MEPYIRLGIGPREFCDNWVYDHSTRVHTHFKTSDEACEHFVRLLALTGINPQFNIGLDSRDYFKAWLNKQPNRTDLAELINLQELV